MATVLFVAFLLLATQMAMADPLDRVMLRWPDNTPFTIRHLLQSVMVFGTIGSGKSSGSALSLVRAILSIPSGGLILFSKPEDRDWWGKRFKEAGREKDLIVFSKDSPARCNFVNYLVSQGADSRNLTEFLTVSGEVLEAKSAKGGEKFWQKSEERLLYNSIELLSQAYGQVTPAYIQKVISTAALKPEHLAEPWWRATANAEALDAATENYKKRQGSKDPKDRVLNADYELLVDFWRSEWPAMDDKPRSSILAGTMNTLHTYNSGLVREVIASDTNTTPNDLMQGKFWGFDFPVHEYQATGRFLMSSAKYVVQRSVLQRKAKPGEPVVVVYADECQNVTNSYDAVYLAECRSHLGCLVYLTQSMHTLFTTME